MDRSTTIARPMPTEPWQRIVGSVLLVVSSACLLFTVGCFPKPPRVIGLKPESPGLPSCAALGPCPFFAKRESPVNGLRPTFRWERFPRTADLAEISPYAARAHDTLKAHEPIIPGIRELMGNVDILKPVPRPMERITAVHYELRLWRVGPGYSGYFERPGETFWAGSADDYKYSWTHECQDSDPGKLVYSKQGLTTPEHQLEISLEPDSRYFWTVRAHFTLDGKRRATEWSEQLLFHPEDKVGKQFSYGKDRCFYPVSFHLIRTP